MRNSGSQWLFGVLLVLWVSFAAVGAGQDGPGETGERFGTALRFMMAVYPDLEDRVDRIQLTGPVFPGIRSRLFGIQFGAGHLFAEADSHSAECYGIFQFSDTGLLKFDAQGKCASDTENNAFRETLTRHPRWSDSQVLAELSRRGARFGPKARDRLVERVPSGNVVSDIIGEIAQQGDITFEMPDRDKGTMLDPFVEWHVEFALPGNPRDKVIASLEPFYGRLTSLLRLPPE